MKTKNRIIMLFILAIFALVSIDSAYAATSGTPSIPPASSGGHGRAYTCDESCSVTLGNKISVLSRVYPYGPLQGISITLTRINDAVATIKVKPHSYGAPSEYHEYELHESETKYLDGTYASIEILKITSGTLRFKVKDIKPVSCEETDMGFNIYIPGTTTVTLENSEKIIKTDDCYRIKINDGSTVNNIMEKRIEFGCVGDYIVDRNYGGGCSSEPQILRGDIVLEIYAENHNPEIGDNTKIIAMVSGDSSLNVPDSNVEFTDVHIAEMHISRSGYVTYSNERSFEIEDKTMENKGCLTVGEITSCRYEGYYKIPSMEVDQYTEMKITLGCKLMLDDIQKEDTTDFEIDYEAKDAAPRITEYFITPNKPMVNEVFEVHMAVEDDLGIKEIGFKETKIPGIVYNYVSSPFSSGGATMLCANKNEYKMTWNISRSVSSNYSFIFNAKDTTGHSTSKILTFEVVDSIDAICSELNQDECSTTDTCWWSETCKCLSKGESCPDAPEPGPWASGSCHEFNEDECTTHGYCWWSDVCKCLSKGESCPDAPEPGPGGKGTREYPQITHQLCDAMTPCPEGLECFSFQGIGLRCAQPDPCSYFKCPERTQCSVAESYPGQVMCFCVGPQCPSTSEDEDTVEYELSTQTVVHTVSVDKQTTSQKITLWKVTTSNRGTEPGEPTRSLHEEPHTTDENRGILETPLASAEYRGRVFIKDSKLFIDTPAGEKPINILPEYAINKAERSSETLNNKKVELIGEAEPVYSVKGQKQAKLIAIIPVTLEIEIKVSAETGEITSVNKPWWSFLAW